MYHSKLSSLVCCIMIMRLHLPVLTLSRLASRLPAQLMSMSSYRSSAVRIATSSPTAAAQTCQLCVGGLAAQRQPLCAAAFCHSQLAEQTVQLRWKPNDQCQH